MTAETDATMRHVGDRLLDLRVSLDPLDDAFRTLGAPDRPLPALSHDSLASMSNALADVRSAFKAAQADADPIDTAIVALQMRELSDKLDMRLWTTFVSGYDHSPLGRVTGVLPDLPVASVEDQQMFLTLVESIGPYLASCIEPTIAASRTERAPLRASLHRAVARWTDLLSGGGAELLPDRSPLVLREQLSALFDSAVREVMARYTEMLAGELAPLARPDERPGLCHIRRGDADYVRLVATHTDDFDGPERIHVLGHEEVARLQDDLYAQAGISRSQGAAVANLLEPDDDEPSYGTYREVLEHIRSIARRAPHDLAPAIDLDGIGELLVREIPEHLSSSAPAAYYLPADGGKRQGTMLVNPARLIGKPRDSALAMIYHEGLPGHHAQFEIARRANLPSFRRSAWFNTFIEGWGLYCEELCEELGLYEGRSARLGKLSLELFRAARLVVDTGLHHNGWPVDQAVRYLVQNAGLSAEAAEGEVARYVENPAQALSYAIGKRRILDARDAVRRQLGGAFTLRLFHNALLRHGSAPISAITGGL